ncbi:hypothetical protein L3X38_031461 [Prunus dulcis]|uniref:CCHC-type domain-containing protein n=1 Tax=Prunus dulcis TaxID=3755 RepID=A0AAD4YV43_PRUDU|nr:hypothetical protein L3X38_031461 [Prunus dulcis]
MKTIFKSHGLWELVEKGIECSDSKGASKSDAKKKEKEESSDAGKMTLTELLMKHANALGLIQGAVSDEIFPRICHEETSKGAWDILMKEFHGDKHVRSVKLQGLHREFEYTRMRDDASLATYLTKLFDPINQMRSYVEDLPRARIVQKLLISLPSAYDSIYYVIEHSTDLDEIEVQKVVASLKSFELRLDRHSGDKTDKAFASLSVNPKSEKYSVSQSDSKDQKNWKTKGKKWDNKSTDGARNPCKHCGKLHFGECRFKGKSKCYNCDKFGHIAKDCYNKKPAQQLNYATQTKSTPTMFYASNKGSASVKGCDDVWYLDSGCSNHMTSRKDALVNVKPVRARVNRRRHSHESHIETKY